MFAPAFTGSGESLSEKSSMSALEASVNRACALKPEVWPTDVSSNDVLASSSLNTNQLVTSAPLVSATAPHGSYAVPGAGPSSCTTWLLTISFGKNPEPVMSTNENGG